jgi:hypothetical protein
MSSGLIDVLTLQAVIVKAVRELRAAQNQDAVFKQELAELRLMWKTKRNFMKLLATFD